MLIIDETKNIGARVKGLVRPRPPKMMLRCKNAAVKQCSRLLIVVVKLDDLELYDACRIFPIKIQHHPLLRSTPYITHASPRVFIIG